jgi:hypothetical protein
MRDRRDAAETRFKAHPDSRDDAADLCALNRTLADVDRTVAVYDAARKENALSTSVRQTFAREIVAPLATARRYSDIVDLLDVPVEYVKKQLTLASKIDEMTKDSEAGLDEETAERMKAFRRSHTVIGLIPAFEALAGMQRREEADRAADLLIEHANVDGTYTELVDAAARAGDVELARSIAERGFAALPESSRGLLRTAFDKLPGRK